MTKFIVKQSGGFLMVHSDLLRLVAAVLHKQKIPYFITGSTASIFYGEPRFTNDIDIIVELKSPEIKALCNSFPPPDFYISENAAQEAVSHHAQFNLIHSPSGLKVDFIVPEPTLFNRSRFTRAKPLEIGQSSQAFFASKEDVILKKMDYYRLGGSEKHLRDITGIIALNLAEIWSLIQENLEKRL
jgi:hypothetical protein